VFCNERGGGICSKCQKSSHILGISSAVSYSNPLAQSLIRSIKYPPYLQKLAEPLGVLLAQRIVESFSTLPHSKNWAVVPVPLHKTRFRLRGFNQAELIARSLAIQLDIPIKTDIIKRLKSLKPQALAQSRSQRMKLQKSHIFAPASQISAPNILLVDDVITTGSTIKSCALALHSAGAKNIWAACVSH